MSGKKADVESTRIISILGVHDTPNDTVITAQCHERNSMRTFKLSRIVEIVDINTGEIFENKEELIDGLEL